MFSNKIILISGGTGSFGTQMLKSLIKTKVKEIRIFSRDEKKQEDLRRSLKDKRVSYIIGDVRDYKSTLSCTRKVDYVFQAAALKQVPTCEFFPLEAYKTNVIGTSNLLNKARDYWINLSAEKKNVFRFHHISTDEVFGSILKDDLFTEESRYDPSSPYAASKASSDHLVRAWHKTYGLPILISNCSNNYGPHQHPEKLIPKLIYNIINNKPLPLYGKGKNSREWIFVDDHCEALFKVFQNGTKGEFYNIGSNINSSNFDIAKLLINISKKKIKLGKNVKIKFVKDRPGHDFRYALDSKKVLKRLKWKSKVNLKKGLENTFNWYFKNMKYYTTLKKRDITKRLGVLK